MLRRALIFAVLLLAACVHEEKRLPASDAPRQRALDGQIAELQQEVDAQSAAMKQFKEENGLDGITQALPGEQERLAAIEAAGAEAQKVWEVAAANADQVRVWVASGKFPDSIDIVGEEEGDERVIELEIQKAKRMGDREALIKKGEDIGDLDDQIAQAERAIASRRAVVDSETGNRMFAQAQGYAAGARNRLDGLAKDRDAQLDRINGMEKVLGEYRAMEGRLNALVARLYELQNQQSAY